jgi:hypothetical protein
LHAACVGVALGMFALLVPVTRVLGAAECMDRGQVRFLLDNLTGDALALGRATGRTRSV